MTDWNPVQYLAFADERGRPALDLIARIPNRYPHLIHDLGCGPGNSTALLADYTKAIAPHYPLMDDGTLLYPFPSASDEQVESLARGKMRQIQSATAT